MDLPKVRGDASDRLVLLLQRAHAGEHAAALAYEGHWRSVRRRHERARIQQIMHEERVHRTELGRMLAEMDAAPARLREILMPAVGLAVAASCFVGGWSIPMVGAARIEHANVAEYVEAASLAHMCGRPAMARALAGMADVERDHETWFAQQSRSTWLGRLLLRSAPDLGAEPRKAPC